MTQPAAATGGVATAPPAVAAISALRGAITEAFTAASPTGPKACPWHRRRRRRVRFHFVDFRSYLIDEYLLSLCLN